MPRRFLGPTGQLWTPADPGGGGTTRDPAIAELARLILESQPCVALTGAGVSQESGIPTFRGPDPAPEEHGDKGYGSTESGVPDFARPRACGPSSTRASTRPSAPFGAIPRRSGASTRPASPCSPPPSRTLRTSRSPSSSASGSCRRSSPRTSTCFTSGPAREDVIEVHGSIRTSLVPRVRRRLPAGRGRAADRGARRAAVPGLRRDPEAGRRLLRRAAAGGRDHASGRARRGGGAAARRRLLARGLPGRRPPALDARRRRQGRGRQPDADLGRRPRRARPARERGGGAGRRRRSPARAAARGRWTTTRTGRNGTRRRPSGCGQRSGPTWSRSSTWARPPFPASPRSR